VFFELLDKMGFENLSDLLKKYSEVRVPDAFAICDLAMRNYEEVIDKKKHSFLFFFNLV
jgi:hypothetical protein